MPTSPTSPVAEKYSIGGYLTKTSGEPATSSFGKDHRLDVDGPMKPTIPPAFLWSSKEGTQLLPAISESLGDDIHEGPANVPTQLVVPIIKIN